VAAPPRQHLLSFEHPRAGRKQMGDSMPIQENKNALRWLDRRLEIRPVILRFAQDDSQATSHMRSREVLSPNVRWLETLLDNSYGCAL